MEMSKTEIYTSWREAKDKKDQVKVLADLNCTTQEHIVEILKEQGADGRLLPRKRKPVETKEPPQEIAASEKKEPQQTVAAEPYEPARVTFEVNRRPKPRVIHELERMMDLFAAIQGAELQSGSPDLEYVEEFDELWNKYYGLKTGWQA